MDDIIGSSLARLKADATSGASELLPRAIAVLTLAAERSPDRLETVARAVAAAQPSMASLWNASLSALRGAEALERFDLRRRRAPAAMVRVAVETLRPASGGRPIRIITCSYSASVLECLRALGGARALRVACAEGRPGFEGRRLAERAASMGLPVDYYTDAALGAAISARGEEETSVLVGADAVAPGWFVNKVGTGMLVAAASRAGIPAYVAATRDKFVDGRVAGLLSIEAHDAREVWEDAPDGVTVRNPYFERVPLDLVSGIVTDAGVLTEGEVGEACRAASAAFPDTDIASLAGSH